MENKKSVKLDLFDTFLIGYFAILWFIFIPSGEGDSPSDKIQFVKIGMTQLNVLDLMGEPQEVDLKTSRFSYDNAFMASDSIYIDFDKENKVKNINLGL